MRTRLTTSLLAAVLALAVACSGEPRPTLGPALTTPSTALPQLSDVHAAIRRGLASLQSLRADVIMVRAGIPGDVRVAIERTAAGLFKQVHSTPLEQVFFSDAREGRAVSYSAPPPEMGSPSAQQEINIPVWGAGPRLHFDNVHLDPVVLAREVLGWEEGRVGREEVAGRAVWVVQGSTPNMLPELRVVTIDDHTGLALRVDALQAGQPQYQVRVENLATNLDAQPAYAVPARVPVSTRDLGNVRMSLEQAGRTAGYAPLVPAWLPPGFTQAEVSFNTGQARGGPRGIAMAFRRGMDVVRLEVGPRSTAPTRPAMSIPAGERFDPEGNPSVPQRREHVRLSAGALTGVNAERSGGANVALSATTDALTVTLIGDVTPDEITRMAESLQPLR
jgi:hypothetical protein